MKEYKTDLFEDQPPFACCLFHKEIRPGDENFLDMLRFTFFPYFQVYSFTFFWLIMNIFVYIYCLHFDHFPDNSNYGGRQFLKVSQKALFEMGQNYPYFLVNKFHYYRLLTSTVLHRNLYHFMIGQLGILVFGSYIEQYSYFQLRFVGFKRILLMAITTGVGAEVIRNIFIFRSSVDSVTPICGLIGYMLGYYITKSQTKWKYYQKERVHMLGVMLLMFLLYLQLSYYYRNISFFSMMAAFGLGFIFYFCDPDEKYERYRIWAIILLILLIGGAGGCLFFNVNPPLVAT